MLWASTCCLACTRSSSSSYSGSSPRVRGTGGACQVDIISLPFIPARAGNGLSSLSFRSGSHGSSPRVRGTGNSAANHRQARRFIPARAGNGSAWGSEPTIPTVHPRACGERLASILASFAVIGSSPRVRGTGASPRGRMGMSRFIPARAGNGPRCAGWSRLESVHPRACGER